MIDDAPGLADINEQNLDRIAVPVEGCDVSVVYVQHVTPGRGILVVYVAKAGTLRVQAIRVKVVDSHEVVCQKHVIAVDPCPLAPNFTPAGGSETCRESHG